MPSKYEFEWDDEYHDSTFEHYLSYVFDYDSWEYDVNHMFDFEAVMGQSVEYIARLFESPVEATKTYSDEKIREGLYRLINSSGGDMYDLFERTVPEELSIKAVKNMYNVFEQLFAPRCTPKLISYIALQYYDYPDVNPLNSLCYMWWDIIPLSPAFDELERKRLNIHCIDVMEKTLKLDSIACQESALHGLGHWNTEYPDRIKQIIDTFLAENKTIDPILREYALHARTDIVL